VQLAEKVGEHAAGIAHHQVMVIGHHARGMQDNASPLRRERQAILEYPIGLGARSKAKRALITAPRNEVRLTRDDSTRMGHWCEAERAACRALATMLLDR
jgi:hypothetical protein